MCILTSRQAGVSGSSPNSHSSIVTWKMNYRFEIVCKLAEFAFRIDNKRMNQVFKKTLCGDRSANFLHPADSRAVVNAFVCSVHPNDL